MKVLFSGHHNPHFITITEYLEKAVQSLGHELIVFEDRQHTIPGRIRERLHLLDQYDLKIINSKMLSLASAAKPDIAIVTGGHRISGETIKKLKNDGVVSILWTIDPPLYFQPILEVAPFYDHIFCQGTEAIELLDRVGIKYAQWLPMACDPAYHHTVECTLADREKYGSDVVFVGSYYPERAALFEKMADFDIAIWGPGWEHLPKSSRLVEKIRGQHTMPDDWLKIYSTSKIILSAHYQAPEAGFPVYQASPRVFEILACGAFQLCDDQRDVFSLFKDGHDLIKFSDGNDLIAKVEYYLHNPQKRHIIAEQGRKTVLARHTYHDRIKELLTKIGYAC
jgi:spore maturation protein CgeB